MLKAGEVMKTLSGYRYGTQTRDIITIHVYPPIPTRSHDWCAYHDGDDERAHMYGWGATEQEALTDLRRIDQECFELSYGYNRGYFQEDDENVD